jgi:hypothetical protein
VSESAIRIDGLAQFQRNLRKLDTDLPKAMRAALNQAAEVVAADARSRVPRRSGRAAASIRVASTQTAARIRAGSNRAPYYPWLDFGGRVGRKKSVKRPFLKQGRYLYAAYFDKRQSGEFERVLTEALLDVARKAGVEVD